MIEHVPLELLHTTLLNCNVCDVLQVSQTSSRIHKALDDDFYRMYAYAKYSSKFWEDAMARPVFYSQPCKTWKEEVLRMERFQSRIEALLDIRWSEEDFRKYWRYQQKGWKI